MNYVLVTPSPRWQITLPKKLREKAGITQAGQTLKLSVQFGKILAEPVKILDYPVRSYTSDEVDEFFAMDDLETIKLKKKGILK